MSFLLLLSQFFLVFSFQKFHYMCLGLSLVYFFWFILFEFHSASWLLGCCLLPNMWHFQLLFFWILFFPSPIYFLLSFLDSSDTNTKFLVEVLRVPEALIFIYLFIVYFLRLGNFYYSTSQFTDSSLCCFCSAVELICWVLKFWLLYFSI